MPPELSASMLGLYVDEAFGRAEAMVAALTVSTSPTDEDVDWAMLAAHSLKGLTAQAGDIALAQEVHDIEGALEQMRRVDASARTAAATALVERLHVIEQASVSHAASPAYWSMRSATSCATP